VRCIQARGVPNKQSSTRPTLRNCQARNPPPSKPHQLPRKHNINFELQLRGSLRPFATALILLPYRDPIAELPRAGRLKHNNPTDSIPAADCTSTLLRRAWDIKEKILLPAMPQDMPPVGGYEAVQYKVGWTFLCVGGVLGSWRTRMGFLVRMGEAAADGRLVVNIGWQRGGTRWGC
jgi:hypothetical protein